MKKLTVDPINKRPANMRAAVAYVDLHDQPAAKYYLLVDWGTGGKSTFQIDGIRETAHSVAGFKHGTTLTSDEVIIQFNKDIPWTMVSAKYANLTTLENLVRREAEDEKQVRALMRSLKDTKNHDGQVSLPEASKVPVLPLLPGQYL